MGYGVGGLILKKSGGLRGHVHGETGQDSNPFTPSPSLLMCVQSPDLPSWRAAVKVL